RRRGGRLEISVHDTGVGIPQSQQRAIFREFHRLDHGAQVARGLGLGLSIVERIARVLDHPIDVRSFVDRGSCFWVEVPTAAAVEGVAAEPADYRIESGRLDGLTVLCVDNEPKILAGMEALLEGWGCRVLTAPDLAGAIRQLENQPAIGGMLVDYHLDEGTGIEAILEMRWRFGAGLPAILLTADRSPDVRDEARARDIPIINKPVKPAALRALLTQWRAQRMVPAE
ncbi:MAG: response regulator, partial [Variibacter sp.]|nr:response regulator [Variibacter sp.]